MTITANATNSSLTIKDSVDPSVASATVQSVTVDGTTANPIIQEATENGAVVTVDSIQPGARVTVTYQLSIAPDAAIGTHYQINRSVVSGEAKTTSTRTLTIVEQGPVARFDTDDDGIEITELGAAATAFARGDLTIAELGQIATSFAQS